MANPNMPCPSLPLLPILLALSLLMLACQTPSPLRGIIKVGLNAPFSGQDYAIGYNALFAAKLALREWNAQGGAAGYRVELVAQDEGEAGEAVRRQAAGLAKDPDIVGVIGHLRDESTKMAMEIYLRAELPFVSLSPEDGRGKDAHGHAYRIVASAREVGEAVSVMVSERLSADRVALLFDPYREGGLADAVALALQSHGVEVVLRKELPANRDLLPNRIRRQDIRAIILLGGGVEEGPVVADLLQAGMAAPILVGPLEGPALVQTAAGSTQGVYYFTLAPHPRDLMGAEGFIERYRALGSREPWGVAALVYDGTNLLLEAIRRSAQEGRPTRQAVAAALASMEDEPGLTGTISFDVRRTRRMAPVYFYRLTGPDLPGTLILKYPQ